ncbi:unnamed protein product [Rotaria socialis]|uniref:Glycoside hydrolase family 5 domain-containing protein n=2 Tax=Rotaria socialis TaxID=392032 RepID=A0A821C6B3_9BILA|nr:unnamed protein product [Rotaria socialis]
MINMRILLAVFTLAISVTQCTIITQVDSNGHGIFVVNTNTTFLRGTNYIRLLNASVHVTFEPDLYPLWDIENAIKQMHNYGYNYIRVFLDCPTLYRGFNLSSPGIPMRYTKNVIDFLLRASIYHIAVMLTASWNPANYQSIVNSYPIPANVTGINMIIFHAGQAAAKAQFFQDLLEQIQKTSLLAFNTIFAIDIFNEISVSVQQQPFSLTDGIVSFDNVSYNMAKGNDRQQLVDVAGNIWLNTIVRAIKSVTPTIMVTASLFSPNAVGHDGFDGVQTRPPGADDRYPLRPGSLINSLADYIDLHVYSSDHTRAEFDGAELTQVKPLLLGETGAFKNNYPNASSAGRAVQNVMIESVNYGFTGWGIWTWDTIEQLSLWTLVDNNNTMNNILAPSVWPFVGPNRTSTVMSKYES